MSEEDPNMDVEMDEEEEEEEETPQPEPPREEDAAIERRRAIQAVMRDPTLSQQEKNQRVQDIMSGGRQYVVSAAPAAPEPAAIAACVHYERNCNIVAPCCNRVFGCRICHNDLSPPGHQDLDRFMVQEVVCKNCNTRQTES